MGGPYDKDMIPWDEYRYAAFARRFNWTPEQVDALPLHVADWIWPIMTALDDMEERRAEQQQADAERKGKKFGRRGRR